METLLDALLAAGIFFAVVAEAIWALGSPSEHFDVRPQSRGSGPDDDFGEQWSADGLPPGLTGDDQLGHHALQQATLGVLAIVGVTAALAALGCCCDGAGRGRHRPHHRIGRGRPLVLGLPIAVTIAFALAVYSLAVERGWLAAGITARAATISVIVARSWRDVTVGLPDAAVHPRRGAGPAASAAATRSRRAYLREVEARLNRRRPNRRRRLSGPWQTSASRWRDLHDVLAHSLTVVNMQVGVASHLLATHPEQAERALAEASPPAPPPWTSCATRLRCCEGTARAGGGNDRAPVPGLDDIAGLVERVAATGLPVTCAGRLPPARRSAAVLACWPTGWCRRG